MEHVNGQLLARERKYDVSRAIEGGTTKPVTRILSAAPAEERRELISLRADQKRTERPAA
jgi:hypothetical protein